MGRPVVATDVGGTSEIIRNGFNGALAPPGAPHALAEALGFVLSGRGAELGRRGRADADQRFAPARFAAAVEDCYRALALRAPERAA
jgi:glycosyltransferase involved in cell wall biosynthesis